MPAVQLKATTMDPRTRALLRVVIPGSDAEPDRRATRDRVETLMGRRPELRFALICEHARFVADSLDV